MRVPGRGRTVGTVDIKFLSPLKCFFQLTILLYSSRVPVGTSLYVPLFLLFLCTFFRCLCSLLWSLGGTGRTEPLFYYFIAGLYPSYYSSCGSLNQ